MVKKSKNAPIVILTLSIIIFIIIEILFFMIINIQTNEEKIVKLNDIKVVSAEPKKIDANVSKSEPIVIESENEINIKEIEADTIKNNEHKKENKDLDIKNIEKSNDVNEIAEKNLGNEVDGQNSKKNLEPKYYIKVNCEAQVVNIYSKDKDGKYTVPEKVMICSTGDSTPNYGVYTISERWNWLLLFGNVYGHYSTQIVGNILFHSVPYLNEGDSGSLEYWEYDKLGEKASLGCVRLTAIDAKWIFDNCVKGTKVEFYEDKNPGPLGKPKAKKISNLSDELKNWDPTDQDKNNPWNSI